MVKPKTATAKVKVAPQVVDTANKPAEPTAKALADAEALKAKALANPLPPVAIEGKKSYNLFKNPQGKWELQTTRRGGRTSKTVYDTEDDAKEVVKALGLDKK